MAQSVAAGRDHRVAEARAGNLFAFAWRQSRRHQPWLCMLAVLIVPLTMVPLELQRRIVDRAIGLQNFDLLLWLGAIYLVVALLQGGLKYLLRVYGGMVGERTVLNLRRAVQSRRASGVEGETVSIVASEVERVGGFVGQAFSEPVLQGGVLVVVLGYMLVVEPTIALMVWFFFCRRFCSRRSFSGSSTGVHDARSGSCANWAIRSSMGRPTIATPGRPSRCMPSGCHTTGSNSPLNS